MTTAKGRRRSDRLMLTIPLVIKATAANGEAFQTPARTIILNQNGAQIETGHALQIGQAVRLVNLINRSETDFRVVGSASNSSENGHFYGVECLDPNANIWDIQFPPSSEAEAGRANGLLECRICHKLALANLSPGELDVLRTAGLVAKRCDTCKAVTPFRYAEIFSVEQEPLDESWISAAAGLAKRRAHRRVYMQLPVGLKDPGGGLEVTKTENTSRGGFCFTSDRDYQPEQGVTLLFPEDATGQGTEMPGRIVRCQRMGGSNRKIYGVRYEPPERRNRRRTDRPHYRDLVR